jgi:hypothetical protein
VLDTSILRYLESYFIMLKNNYLIDIKSIAQELGILFLGTLF